MASLQVQARKIRHHLELYSGTPGDKHPAKIYCTDGSWRFREWTGQDGPVLIRCNRYMVCMDGDGDTGREFIATLGLPPDRFPQPRDRRREVAVMNYWVMFNQNPVVDSADLLVIDDAHLAERALDSLYSAEIDRYDHPALFWSLVQDMAQAFPDYAALQDALTDGPTRAGTELLSFLDQAAFADRLRAKIDTADELRTDSDLRFRWGRVRERLLETNIYCSTRSLGLRPYVYPVRDNSRYADPQQRIYMSATIGDPADLARRLGTRPIVKLPLDAAHAGQTYGRRLLVLNPDDSADLPWRSGKVIYAALRIQPKSVWLCASRTEAERYRAVISSWLEANKIPGPCWQLSSRGDEIEQFKSAPAGHLFVAGRFDGMDFSADQCRLIVLATQPRAINSQEAFATDYLRDAGFMMQRLNQRIIQALGRCNRADDDYGVYILADRRFVTHLSQEDRRRGLPANIQAEIDLAENGTELDDDQLVARVAAFLQGDFAEFDHELAEVRADLPAAAAPGESTPDNSAEEVTGWLELHSRQDYRAAESHFHARQEACSERELGAFAQWCEAKAAYLEGRRGDAAAARPGAGDTGTGDRPWRGLVLVQPAAQLPAAAPPAGSHRADDQPERLPGRRHPRLRRAAGAHRYRGAPRKMARPPVRRAGGDQPRPVRRGDRDAGKIARVHRDPAPLWRGDRLPLARRVRQPPRGGHLGSQDRARKPHVGLRQ